MTLSWIDLLVVVACVVLVVLICIKMTKDASAGREDFFVRLKLKMAASTFASDTPLFVTNLVRSYEVGCAWIK